jgi:hypothetical protein
VKKSLSKLKTGIWWLLRPCWWCIKKLLTRIKNDYVPWRCADTTCVIIILRFLWEIVLTRMLKRRKWLWCMYVNEEIRRRNVRWKQENLLAQHSGRHLIWICIRTLFIYYWMKRSKYFFLDNTIFILIFYYEAVRIFTHIIDMVI